MRKRSLILFLLFISLGCYSQNHLKFMGIPIDGNIDTFILALKAKGFELYDDESVDGGKWLRGQFVGKFTTVIVGYDKQSKNVNWCSAENRCNSQQQVRDRFSNLRSLLLEKYNKYVDKDVKEGENNWPKVVIKTPEGMIMLMVRDQKDRDDYDVYITYYDTINCNIANEKEKQQNLEDI